MSFIETVRRARDLLREEGRITLRVLKREFDLDDEALEELVEELVVAQQVAGLDGKVVVWLGGAGSAEGKERAVPRAVPLPHQPGAERRQLTVMFCDLVGSTDLSRRLDAEDLRNVVRAYQDAASQVIEHYEGHIAQYLGDGLLVYFGYPQAHEDDAERAVHVGLGVVDALGELNSRLQTDHGLRIGVRIGIHTGPVVVGEMGGGTSRETLAVGDTVNVAARLEGFAEPDTVVISNVTLRLVAGLFVTEDRATPELKGISEPIRVHRVLHPSGVTGRLDRAPALTPFVGREQELGLLLARFEQAEEGRGQAVGIAGEAGIGKSRLVHRLRERLREAHTLHNWLECRCSPYTRNSAFYPVIEVVEQALGFDDALAPEQRLARLERGLALAGLEAAATVPLLASLLSLRLPERYAPLEISPQLQRQKTLEALLAWTLALGEKHPLVLAVEDLHWADPSTLEWLGLLIEQCATAGVLLLLTFRPEFEPQWPSRGQVLPVALSPLSRRQVKELVTAAAGEALPGALVERLAARSDGIPLFVEELAKGVVESGRDLASSLSGLEIPETLQDSLMARLDRLGEAKQVAQFGAALGREFPYALLEAVAPMKETTLREGLGQLLEAELVYQRGLPPKATYTFKHALVQDTAYRSLLESQRRELHGRIADALEQRFPEQVAREPEGIARHCEEAGRLEQAIAYYQRAGDEAQTRYANEEAIGHLRQALELLATLPTCRERDQRELGLQMATAVASAAAHSYAHTECEAAYARARELTEQIGDAPELPHVLVGLSVSYYTKGDLASARKLAEQALAVAERLGETRDLAHAHLCVGLARYCQGELSAALQHFERDIRLDDASDGASIAFTQIHWDPGVMSRSYAALCHWMHGQPDRARALSQEAVSLAIRRENAMSQAMALYYAGELHSLRRDLALTRECGDECIALSERIGFPLTSGAGRIRRGWACAHLGEGEQGVAEIKQGIAEVSGTGTGGEAAMALAVYAEAVWRIGRHGDALRALRAGVARSGQQGDHRWDAELCRLQGEILLDQEEGRAEEAEGLFREALEIARRQEAKGWELRAATSLARLWRHQGKRAEARTLLQQVYDCFTEGFDTGDLKDARALLEQLA